ncbi:MAG TPA: ATP-binding protein [Ignavibacteriaceae bacterium]|nr:ATP-binding protein [Ignavibacteriaceae bacterium]
MTIPSKYRVSLKQKMIFIIGGITAVMMAVISLSILIYWRGIIINAHQQKAKAVTIAFSSPIINAIIYGQNKNSSSDNLLETHIKDLIDKVDEIKSVAVINHKGVVIAHSNFAYYNSTLSDSRTKKLLTTDKIITAVYKHNEYGWITETVSPLRIGTKNLGILKISFDTEIIREEISSVFFLLLTLTSLLIGATILVLYLIIGRLTDSLRKLIEAMDKTDFEKPANFPLPKRNDEIGFLVERFENLQYRLQVSKSKLVEAQKQVYHAEKLASIGRLASGVAHEINNPLNGLRSCLYAIKKEPNNHEQSTEYINLMDEGITYIENVIQKLLGFARQKSKEIEPVNLNEIISKVILLLEYKLRQKQIDFSFNQHDPLPLIKVDPLLIQEVIMNLMINSLDAVSNNGKIIITTSAKDNGLVLSIKDNGIGISAEHSDYIFDPFFTTKDEGEGTGLGLSVSLGIIEAHGGSIKVKSIPNQETEFTVYLPIEESK